MSCVFCRHFGCKKKKKKEKEKKRRGIYLIIVRDMHFRALGPTQSFGPLILVMVCNVDGVRRRRNFRTHLIVLLR